MNDDEHVERVAEARTFYESHRDFHPGDDQPEWLVQMGILLEELDRDGKIIDGLYEALGPANDDVLDLVMQEVDG